MKTETEGRFYVRVEKSIGEGVLIFPIGTYHRDGEERDFTRADAEEMVRNFDDNILERQPPVNLEHERAGGRVGHVTRLWVADDGVRGEVKAVAGHEGDLRDFDYISPEIKWLWTHPFTAQEYENVLMGLALTNYPYLLGRMALHSGQVWMGTDWGDWRSLGDAELFALYEALARVE